MDTGRKCSHHVNEVEDAHIKASLPPPSAFHPSLHFLANFSPSYALTVNKMTPLQLSALLLTLASMAWCAAITGSPTDPATTSPSPERASSPPAALEPAHPRRAPPVDNTTSSVLDIINLALLNLAYTETIPYGEVPIPGHNSLIILLLVPPTNSHPPDRSSAARPTPRTTSSPAPTPCSARASRTSPRGKGTLVTSRPPWEGASICGADRTRGSIFVRGRMRTG